MIKKVAATVLIFFVSLSLFAKTKIVPIPDVNKPGVLMVADQQQFYLYENESILIFSLKDFKLKKKFGKRGEGPQEFVLNPAVPMWLDVSGENILVESFGKLSWWTKDGRFIKELKLSNPLIIQIMHFGKNFVGLGYKQGKVRTRSLSIYDEKMNPIKELISKEDSFQFGKGLKVLDTLPIQTVGGDKLYTAWTREFNIKVFDKEGKELRTISKKFEKRKVNQQDKDDFIEFFKTSPMTKDFFEMLKPFKFPETWFSVGGLIVENNKIYVMTTTRLDDKNKTELYILDQEGEILKKTQVPLILNGPVLPYPFFIKNNHLYQLVENIEDEIFEMHITEIK